MDKKIIVESVDDKNKIVIVRDLAHEIWTQHYTPIIGQEQVVYMLDKYQSIESITQNLRDGYIYSVVYYDKTPCGYCAIKPDNGIFLSKFYVKEVYRGMGLGKALLEFVYSYAEKSCENRMWLTCNKYNSKSLAAYQKLGFSIIDKVVTDIGGGFVMDDYILEKKL